MRNMEFHHLWQGEVDNGLSALAYHSAVVAHPDLTSLVHQRLKIEESIYWLAFVAHKIAHKLKIQDRHIAS